LPAPSAAPPRLLLPDPAWAVVLGIASVGYFLLTIAVGTSFFTHGTGPSVTAASVWGTAAVLAVQPVPLLWRTRRPVLSFWLVFACFLAATAISIDRNLTVSPTLLFAVFSVTARTGTRTWATTAGVAAGLDTAVQLTLGVLYGGALTPVAVLAVLTRVVPTYLAPCLAGLLYGSQRRRAELAAAQAGALREAAEAQTAAAVASERNRMARELHDVAAHHLSGILLQTRAAIRVRESDPATTGVLLESIRSEGELTMLNLREVIGVLREDGSVEDGAGPGVPAPTLASLPSLIAAVRDLHPELDLAVSGDLGDLSPATSLACFRIIQESLTNARKHAPGGAVSVAVRRDAREVVVEVRNGAATDPAAPEPPARRRGYGLVGMRERAAMLGGALDTGPAPGGGWRTLAVIPLDRQVAA
jgi:signal transduction histidine kinase